MGYTVVLQRRGALVEIRFEFRETPDGPSAPKRDAALADLGNRLGKLDRQIDRFILAR